MGMNVENNEEPMILDLDEIFGDADIIPYIQIRDDDGNIIEERPATEEEIKELMNGN